MHPEIAQASRADVAAPGCTHEAPIYRRVVPFSFALVSRVPSLLTFRGASRENTHVYTCTYTVHVHARDARRAKRRAKESAPCRPELSRSHGSCLGSGGDIPTYLPTYRAGCAGACVSQAPLHILLPSSSLFLILVIPPFTSTRLSSFTSADTPRYNPREGNRRRVHDSCG